MPTTERQLITVSEAAERLNVSYSTVIRAVRNGDIPHVQRVGESSKAAYLLDPEAVEAERQRRLERALQTVTALEGPG